MYRFVVKQQVRRAYGQISRGEYEAVVSQFAPDVRFQFLGTHALGGERRGPEAVREWFATVSRIFPDLRLEPRDVLVNGWPWNTRVAVRFDLSASLKDGTTYRNTGMQYLRLRWGRAVEDLLFEDTQELARALEVQTREQAAEAAAASR
jgi:ketosteroid isomerase-like protein